MSKRINFRLYLFQLLSVCFVIFIHAFKNGESYILDSFGRPTVLLFFILSSYFYNEYINRENYRYTKTIFKCLRLLLMVVITILVYAGIFILLNINNLDSIKILHEFSFVNIGQFIAKSELVFIWFVFALIVCYLLFPFINKIKWIHKSKHSIILPIIILIAVYVFRIFAGKYDLAIGSISISRIEVTRNFFFTGLPCFLIGTYIYDHVNDMKKIDSSTFYPLFAGLIIFSMLETHFHQVIGTKENEFYLANIPLSILILIYSIQNPVCKSGNILYKLFGSTGPGIFYFSHVLFLMIYRRIFLFDKSLILIIPAAVLSSLLIAFIYNCVKKMIKKLRMSTE